MASSSARDRIIDKIEGNPSSPEPPKPEKEKPFIHNNERSRAHHRRKLLQKEPIVRKVQDALEHAIVAGAQVRRGMKRRRICENPPKQLQQQQQQNDEDTTQQDEAAAQLAAFAATNAGLDPLAAAVNATVWNPTGMGDVVVTGGTNNAGNFTATATEPPSVEAAMAALLGATSAPASTAEEATGTPAMEAAATALQQAQSAAANTAAAATGTASGAASVATSNSSTSKQPTIQAHAEDIRIYGRRSAKREDKGYYPMKPWPASGNEKTSKGVKNATKRNSYDTVDSEYNVEYGDSIPPVLFRLARLSGEYPTPQKLKILEDVPSSQKSLQSTDTSIALEQVPRTILEKCWERAVHVASNVMAVPVSGTQSSNDVIDLTATESSATTAETTPQQLQQPTPPPQQLEQQPPPTVVQYKNERRCRFLGIDLPISQKHECPRCTRTFDTLHGLKLHYYGSVVTGGGSTNNSYDEGCCFPLVRTRLLETIDDVLQHHVQSQTDQLLEIVLSGAAAAKRSDGGNGAQPEEEQEEQDDEETTRFEQLLGWKDVLSYLERAVETDPNATEGTQQSQQSLGTTSATTAASHPILETLQLNGDITKNPLLLNPMIVQTLKRRLLDRYTPAPF